MEYGITIPSFDANEASVTVSKWHKSLGDTVNRGEVLVEVDSCTATCEILAPTSGVLETIFIPSGGESKVGEQIGVINSTEEGARITRHIIDENCDVSLTQDEICRYNLKGTRFLGIEEAEGIVTITIKREDKLNALSSDVFREFSAVSDLINRSPRFKACIIRGAGKAFCAGVDINDFNREFNANDLSTLNVEWGAVAGIKIPTIACVHGYALGGGFELALMCDIIVAAESTKFGFPEINIGLIPGNGGTQRLPRIIGKQRAFKMMVTGEHIDTTTAYSMGLINKIAPDGSEYCIAKELAIAIAKRSRHSLIALKSAINASQNQTLQCGIEYENEIFKRLLTSNETRNLIYEFCNKK